MTLKPDEIDAGFKVLGLFETSEREKILCQIANYQTENIQQPYKIEERTSSSNW